MCLRAIKAERAGIYVKMRASLQQVFSFHGRGSASFSNATRRRKILCLSIVRDLSSAGGIDTGESGGVYVSVTTQTPRVKITKNFGIITSASDLSR